jgi:hypothetical protein
MLSITALGLEAISYLCRRFSCPDTGFGEITPATQGSSAARQDYVPQRDFGGIKAGFTFPYRLSYRTVKSCPVHMGGLEGT